MLTSRTPHNTTISYPARPLYRTISLEIPIRRLAGLLPPPLLRFPAPLVAWFRCLTSSVPPGLLLALALGCSPESGVLWLDLCRRRLPTRFAQPGLWLHRLPASRYYKYMQKALREQCQAVRQAAATRLFGATLGRPHENRLQEEYRVGDIEDNEA